MKNKNGFIATGLIYSFFLIFLTLFLATIINHINNKVSLNNVEQGIKSELNAYKTVRNFEPGDLISFVDYCQATDVSEAEKTSAIVAGTFKVENSYIVSSVVTNDDENTVCTGSSECLILYSYRLYNSANHTEPDSLSFEDSKAKLTLTHIKNDISTGYLNGTYINKIIYNFDTSKVKNYSLGSVSVDDETVVGAYLNASTSKNCFESNSIYCNDYGKIVSESSSYFRGRHIVHFDENKILTCNNIEDVMGVIYVKE